MTTRDVERLRAAADAPQLGARLRELRDGVGMSAKDLAAKLGISPSAISQIERGTMQPSVSRLIAIVDALGVPLAQVFGSGDADAAMRESAPSAGTAEGGFSLVRSRQVTPITLEGGVTFRRLSPPQTTGIDFFESTYPPNSRASERTDFFHHEGFEVGNVVSGELTIEFEHETVVLRAGDSITFPSTISHFIQNSSPDTPAVATWLIVHPGSP